MDTRTKENVVDARIKKVLSTRTDTMTMLESLDAISDFFLRNGNTPDSRRALRQDVEFQNILLAKKFLGEFEKVREGIAQVDERTVQLEGECQDMAKKVSKADENMKMFMQKASILEERRNFLIQQSKDINTFLTQYQLSPEEVNCIHYAPINASNTETFFAALKRLKQAYMDCKNMAEHHQYSAGFELLEILGNHQDVGYQRLFEWLKAKCDNDDENDEVDGDDDVALQMAVKYLREVPFYFTQCQDLIISSRRTLLVQRFILALTHGGGRHATSRAIEVHAHNSVRYIGDILSWMHQTMASEKEFLFSIFGRSEINDSDPSSPSFERNNEDGAVNGLYDRNGGDDYNEYNDEEKKKCKILSISEILSQCLEGLGRPLRVRIMQALENCGKDIEKLYVIADLLHFYMDTISETLDVENSVLNCVSSSLLECKSLFQNALKNYSESLVQSTLSSVTIDLMSSNATKESARLIQNLLRVHQNALSELSMSPEDDDNDCSIYNVLGSCIHPILQACRSCGNNVLQQGSDMAIFMLNNVSTIKVVLTEASKSSSGKKAAEPWIDLLDTEVATWESVLISESSSRFLQRSEMERILDLVEVLPAGLVASEQPGLSQDQVSSCLRSFYASLFSVSTPLIERLQDLDLREQVRVKTSEKISNAYAKVHALVEESSNKYTTNILTHSIHEVEVLLGCST